MAASFGKGFPNSQHHSRNLAAKFCTTWLKVIRSFLLHTVTFLHFSCAEEVQMVQTARSSLRRETSRHQSRYLAQMNVHILPYLSPVCEIRRNASIYTRICVLSVPVHTNIRSTLRGYLVVFPKCFAGNQPAVKWVTRLPFSCGIHWACSPLGLEFWKRNSTSGNTTAQKPYQWCSVPNNTFYAKANKVYSHLRHTTLHSFNVSNFMSF